MMKWRGRMRNKKKLTQQLGRPLLLGALALVLYLPGITWGLPGSHTADRLISWAPDEIAALDPLVRMHQLFTGKELGILKYPLFHNLVLAAFYAPYLGFEWLTGGLVNPQAHYPFGFTNPLRSIHALLLISRSVSLLMAAATVVVAYFFVQTLWGRRAGLLAGVFVLLLYPVVYYGKMANVDVPAQFWCSLVFLLSAYVLREGWTVKRAIWMGVFAALAIATKDQSYAVLLLLPFALIPAHIRAMQNRGQTSTWARAKAPLAGLLVSAAVYAGASGLALSPAGYFRHIAFIRTAWYQETPSLWYYRYSDNWRGYLGVLGESLRAIIDSLGWPLFLASCAGVLLAAWKRQERPKLLYLLPIPALILGVILPVRHTALRFIMPLTVILACHAAYAFSVALQSSQRLVRMAAWVVIIGGSGVALLRDVDLTRLLSNDPRCAATRWLETHVRPGERLEYFESPSGKYRLRLRTFPRIPEGVQLVDAAVPLAAGSRVLDGEFVMTMGPEDHSEYWFCPAWVEQGLRKGSLGYDLVATFHTSSLFPHPDLPHVNPEVRLFARRD